MVCNWVGDLGRWPCFDCEPPRKHQAPRQHQPLKNSHSQGHEVELAVSPLVGMRGAAGYHSSVIVDNIEYSFSPGGIVAAPQLTSHQGNKEVQRFHVGISPYGQEDMLDFLEFHFLPGTYDLLNKNCNSFSDCAIYYLCEQRLWLGFRAVERLGALADSHVGFLQLVSNGSYAPNPHAASFDLEQLIAEIGAERATNEAYLDGVPARPVANPGISGLAGLKLCQRGAGDCGAATSPCIATDIHARGDEPNNDFRRERIEFIATQDDLDGIDLLQRENTPRVANGRVKVWSPCSNGIVAVEETSPTTLVAKRRLQKRPSLRRPLELLGGHTESGWLYEVPPL